MLISILLETGSSFPASSAILFAGNIAEPPVAVMSGQNTFVNIQGAQSVSGIQILDGNNIIAQCNPFPPVPPSTPVPMTDGTGAPVSYWVSWNPASNAIVIMDDLPDTGSGMFVFHHIALFNETIALLKDLFNIVDGKHVGENNYGTSTVRPERI